MNAEWGCSNMARFFNAQHYVKHRESDKLDILIILLRGALFIALVRFEESNFDGH